MQRLDRSAKIATILIAVVALFAALEYAEQVLAPVTLALVIGVVLSPLSDFWERHGMPPAIGAMISLLLGLFVLVAILVLLIPIFDRVISSAPQIWGEIRRTYEQLQTYFSGLTRLSEQMTSVMGESGSDEEGTPVPSITTAIWQAPAIGAQVVIFVGSLYFFLMTRMQVYDFLAMRFADAGDRVFVARRLKMAERKVSQYFLAISMINAGLGVAVAGAMTAIGLPSPILWGAVAALMNFVLYLGPSVMIFALAVAGIVVFEGIAAFAPPAIFFCFNMIEAQFVTPTVLGRNLRVNPLLIFLSLVFFLWLWGPLGGIVSIPLLIWALVLTQDFSTARMGEPGPDDEHEVRKETHPVG